jgi:hypothetical protein
VKKRGVPRPKKPTCAHENPVEGFGYVAAGDEADRLHALGWRQDRCRECGLWAIWVDPKKSIVGRASVVYVDGLHLTDEAEKIAAFDAFHAGWAAAIADEVGGS